MTITIDGVNDAPTAIQLSNASVDENSAGAVIGNLSASDPDTGSSHSFSVDDSRFEVVAGQLKLKSGQSLNFESEPAVTLHVTATDNGSPGLSIAAAITETYTLFKDAAIAI